MYYRLGPFGKFIWSLTAFFVWLMVTTAGMGFVFDIIAAANPRYADVSHSMGVNSGVGQFGMMFLGIVLISVPIVTAAIVHHLNKHLKGNDNVQHSVRPASRQLRHLPQQSPRRLSRSQPDPPADD